MVAEVPLSHTMFLTEDEAIELMAFLVTAARIQLDEAPRYAPMRLLSAVERLNNMVVDRASPEGRKILDSVMTEISHMERGRRLFDNAEDVARLDGLCGTVAQHLVDRAGLARRAE